MTLLWVGFCSFFVLFTIVAGLDYSLSNEKINRSISSINSSARKKGSIAFIGSYGSSSLFPIVQQLKANSISIPPFLNQFGDAEAVANLVKTENVESIFTTGDNNYDYGCESDIDNNIGRLYKDYIGNYSGSYGVGASVNEFFPTLGNHDVLVYEAYLVRNDQPITLDIFTKGDVSTYIFSRENWEARLADISISK